MLFDENPDVSKDVWEFMERCGQKDQLNTYINFKHEALRDALITEEFHKEYVEARVELLACVHEGPEYCNGQGRERYLHALAAYADVLVDSIVVLVGTFHSMGLDFKAHWNEVQRANMAKAIRVTCPSCKGDGSTGILVCAECKGERTVYNVLRREDGKVLKPEGWMPPVHLPAIEARLMRISSEPNERFRALPVDPPVVKP